MTRSPWKRPASISSGLAQPPGAVQVLLNQESWGPQPEPLHPPPYILDSELGDWAAPSVWQIEDMKDAGGEWTMIS